MTLERKIKISYDFKGDCPERLQENVVLTCFSQGNTTMTAKEYINTIKFSNINITQEEKDSINFICEIDTISYDKN